MLCELRMTIVLCYIKLLVCFETADAVIQSRDYTHIRIIISCYAKVHVIKTMEWYRICESSNKKNFILANRFNVSE